MTISPKTITPPRNITTGMALIGSSFSGIIDQNYYAFLSAPDANDRNSKGHPNQHGSYHKNNS